MSARFEAMLAGHQADEVVAVAGDWHGGLGWAQQKVEQMAAKGITLILHLGDFGYWSGKKGKRYLEELDKTCQEHGIDIWVTGGNHEEWGRAYLRWANTRRQDDRGYPVPDSWDTERIWLLPRPYRFAINGASFLSFGGAASVDFDVRTPDRDWWIEEMITHEQVSQAVEGGYADIMLTHETPDPPYAVTRVEHLLATNPMGFSLEALSYSAVSRRRLTKAFLGVKPRLLAHGHLHIAGQKTFQLEGTDYPTTVVGTSQEHTSENIALIELATFRGGPHATRD